MPFGSISNWGYAGMMVCGGGVRNLLAVYKHFQGANRCCWLEFDAGALGQATPQPIDACLLLHWRSVNLRHIHCE